MPESIIVLKIVNNFLPKSFNIRLNKDITEEKIPFRNSNSVNVSNEELFHLRMIEAANLIDQQSGADFVTAFTSEGMKND